MGRVGHLRRAGLRPDRPSLVPTSVFNAADDAYGAVSQPARRTGRDWTVDVICVVVSLAGGAVLLAASSEAPQEPAPGVVVADGVLGLTCCVAIWFRRRFPVGVAVATALLSAVSASAGCPALIAMFTVAVHRRGGTALAVGLLNIAATGVFFWLRPQDVSFWIAMVTITAVCAAVVAWGMFVRARRQLIVSLHERAERAEDEQRLLAEQARQAERARIAREMHDVVAHRVSLMALHAGALEMRPDLPAADIEHTAGLIRTTAKQALEELRNVIGVLREQTATPATPEAPQPTLADIARLVEDSQRAGAHVELSMEVTHPEQAPSGLGRDAFRIVQEALTNVNKHARGTRTVVTVSGAAGHGLQVTVRNRLPMTPSNLSTLPGSGMGLVGLTERVELSGGSLHHGPTDDGEFVVSADLPWPT